MSSTESHRYDLFVSYARRDNGTGWVTKLSAALRELRLGPEGRRPNVFFDTEAIETRQDWEARLKLGLAESQLLVTVLSPDFFASPYCRWEWEEFARHELLRQLPGEGIVPVYARTDPAFEGTQRGELDPFRADLGRRQYHDFRDENGSLEPGSARWAEELGRVCRSVEAAFLRRESARRSPSNVPPVNEKFVGRRAELRQLHDALAFGRLGVVTSVNGMGGIGKSSLAFAYAHAWADAYPGGRWLVSCDRADSLKTVLNTLADVLNLGLSPTDQKDPELTFRKVYARLLTGPRTLLILDNVDDPFLLSPRSRAECLPATENLRLVATTREEPRLFADDPHSSTVRCLTLEELPEEDGLALLGSYRPFQDEADVAAARGILARIGRHTLATEVVAVYLWQHASDTYAAYLERLKQDGTGLVEETGRDRYVKTRHGETLIGRLLEPTLARLQREDPTAHEVLLSASLLPPDAIPAGWLWLLVRKLEQDRQRPPPEWGEVLERLSGLRLLTPGESGETYRLHRLVQHAVRRRTPANILSGRADRLMERLGFRELDQAFQVVRGWAVSEHRKVRYLTDLADSLGSANRQRFGAFVRGHLFLGCLTAVYGLLWSICMGWGAVFILVLPALYTPGMSLLYSQGRAVELRCRGLVRTLTGDGSWGRGVAAKLRLELTHALVSLFAPGVALLCNLFVYQGGRRDESVVGVVGLFIALGLAGSLAVVGLARLLFRDSFWRLVGITILAMAVGILLPALGW